VKGREVLSVIASICGIVAFVAGTAASSIYAGIVWAGLLLGSTLLGALAPQTLDAWQSPDRTLEAAKELSFGSLVIATVVNLGLLVGIFLNVESRGGTWNQSFGFAQLAGIALIAMAAYVIWHEWTWYRDKRYKKCPDCARTVLAEARKCEFCSHRFQST